MNFINSIYLKIANGFCCLMHKSYVHKSRELDLVVCACTRTHLTRILSPQLREVNKMKLLCKLKRATYKGGSRAA